MCQPQNTIRLCTCPTAKRKPAQYWALHRPARHKQFTIIGDLIPPVFNTEIFAATEALLLDQLNNQNCFDVAVVLKEGDLLHLHFEWGTEQYDFYFQCSNGRWASTQADSFELCNRYNSKNRGCIENSPREFGIA